MFGERLPFTAHSKPVLPFLYHLHFPGCQWLRTGAGAGDGAGLWRGFLLVLVNPITPGEWACRGRAMVVVVLRLGSLMWGKPESTS